MWLHITCTSDKTRGPQEVAKTKEGRSRINLTIQAERRNEGVGGGSSSKLSCWASWLSVDMLVILCTEQVREVRDFEQIHDFALLRFTAHFSVKLCLVVKTKNRLNVYFTGAFLAVTCNILKLITIASLFGAVTLVSVASGKSDQVFNFDARASKKRSSSPRRSCSILSLYEVPTRGLCMDNSYSAVLTATRQTASFGASRWFTREPCPSRYHGEVLAARCKNGYQRKGAMLSPWKDRTLKKISLV